MTRTRRFAAAVVTAIGLGLVNPSVAAADPAGPTDYLSEITGIEPATDGIALRMIGGDSFLELEVAQGLEVIVIGYRGEDYLWFAPDGTVYENERSPSVYLNEDRFGEQEPPDAADHEAAPVWREIGTGGRFAWHDHRTHWMNRARPPGAEPGDIILEAVVPLVVNGQDVSVTVQSVWQKAPAPWGAVTGVAVGLALTIGLARRFGRTAGSAAASALAAVTALAIGGWQVLSLPPETGPSVLLWLLPAVALFCAAAALWSIRGNGWDDLISGLVLLAALEVAIWSWFRFDGVTAAIIPTDAPFLIDRAVTVAALVIGILSLAFAGSELIGRYVRPTNRLTVTD